MKVFLITLLCFIFCVNIYADGDEICCVLNSGVSDILEPPWIWNQLAYYDPPSEDRIIDLAIHIVRYSDSTGGIPEPEIDYALADLNSAFGPVKFDFRKTYTFYIDDDYYAHSSETKAQEMFNSFMKPACINVYFVPHLGKQGIAQSIPGTSFAIDNSMALNGSTIVHEMGHCFGLWHTHETLFGVELVDGSNGKTAGDCIAWTPADNCLKKPEGGSYKVDEITCLYTGNPPWNPDTHNFMSYSRNHCRDSFTDDQIWAMNYTYLEKNILGYLDDVPVIFSNEFNSEGIPDTWFEMDGISPIKSGTIRALANDELKTVKTQDEKFNNYSGGKDVKHHNWNDINSEFFLSHNFTPLKNSQNSKFQIANFKTLEDVFIGVENTAGSEVEIKFNDPWFVAADGSQPNFFKPYLIDNENLEYSVFLNQGWPLWDPPYYSVQAPNQPQIVNVNGKNLTYDFDFWSSSPANGAEFSSPNNTTTPVIFRSPGVEIIANMKARATSNAATATIGNNGRKLFPVFYSSGFTLVPGLVYADRGHIYKSGWLSPTGWLKDTKLATAANGIVNQHPAGYYLYNVTGNNYDDDIIVWDEYNTNSETHTLGSTVGDFSQTGLTSPHNLRPSAAGYRLFTTSENPLYSTAVAYVGGGFETETLQDGIRLWFTNDNSIVQLNFDASADYPTLDVRKYSETINYVEPHYMLAWQQNNNIHYLEFERDDDSGENINISQQSILTEEYIELLDNRHPSIVTERDGNNDVVFVAWEARRGLSPDDGGSEDYPVVCVAEKLWNGWQPLDIYTMNSEGDHNPVVTAVPKISGTGFDYALSYEDNNGEIYYIRRTESESLDIQYFATNGNHPCITTVGDEPVVAWTEQDVAPYRVMTAEPESSDQSAEGLMVQHSRVLSFEIQESLQTADSLNLDANVRLELLDPQLLSAGQLLTLPFKTKDTTLTNENAFSSQPFTISEENSNLFLTTNIFVDDYVNTGGTAPNLPIWKLRIRDVNTNEIIQIKDVLNLNQITGQTHSSFSLHDTLEISMANFLGRTVVVEGLTFLIKNSPKVSLSDFYDLRHISEKRDRILSVTDPGQIITRFDLKQNYPNPFNPTTTISFDLPEQSEVQLEIFNIAGQKVNTLVNQSLSAGAHSVIWNGRDENGQTVASGVYIYRLTAGTQHFTKKMMLMK